MRATSVELGRAERRHPRHSSAFSGLWAWWRHCRARAAERRALAQLSEWGLRDIGITRAEAGGEAQKWPWHP